MSEWITPKAVLCDIDNSLIISAKGNTHIPEKVNTSFRRVGKEVPTGFITGKNWNGTTPFIEKLQPSGLSVLSYGGQIYDSRNSRNAVIMEHPLLPDTLRAVTKVLEKEGLGFIAEDEVRNYSNEEYHSEKPKKVFMLVSRMPTAVIDNFLEAFHDVSQFGEITLFKSNKHDHRESRLFITHQRASKLQGLQSVAEILEIEPKEIFGLGDSQQDVEFIRACTGVAVENAISEVKKHAVFIAPSVKDNGAAYALDTFFPKH